MFNLWGVSWTQRWLTCSAIEIVLDNFQKIFSCYTFVRVSWKPNFGASAQLELSRSRNLVKTFQLHYQDSLAKLLYYVSKGRILLRFLFELLRCTLNMVRISCHPTFTLALAYLFYRRRRRPHHGRVKRGLERELKTAHTINHSIDIANFSSTRTHLS